MQTPPRVAIEPPKPVSAPTAPGSRTSAVAAARAPSLRRQGRAQGPATTKPWSKGTDECLGPGLIDRCSSWRTSSAPLRCASGDTAFTVPLFDQYMKRVMPQMEV